MEEASRDAVTQMRRLLGTLREGESDAGADESRTTDAGIGDLATLVDAVSGQGLSVSLDLVEAQPEAAGRLPRGIWLAVYRTVQEALTNVRRHAGATAVVLRLSRVGSQVSVHVEDDGVGFDPATVPGSGL